MKKMNKKGFTLAELLIVVAIIAVLVAISIPVFTNQLEKSREATDAANIRAKYAEIVVAYLGADTSAAITTGYTVTLKQQNDGWDTSVDLPEGLTVVNTPKKDGTAALTCDADGNVTCTFST